jgi:hypothetical protein
MDAAIALARTATGAPADSPAHTDPVRRLDRDAPYVLVRLGPEGGPGWLAAVDLATGEVLTWAANPSGHTTAPPGQGELVWRPSTQSRSMLYPLRLIDEPSGRTFVDLAGRHWTTLSDARG